MDTPICSACGVRRVSSAGRTRGGRMRFRKKCDPCRGRDQAFVRRRNRALEAAGGRCSRCGFIAEVPRQLHVDHVVPLAAGGSNDPSNFQVLCANCHELKSFLDES